jgi:hypothetical protein
MPATHHTGEPLPARPFWRASEVERANQPMQIVGMQAQEPRRLEHHLAFGCVERLVVDSCGDVRRLPSPHGLYLLEGFLLAIFGVSRLMYLINP